MAEDTRKIVYYKGIKHFLDDNEGTLAHITEVDKSSISRVVLRELLLTEEEYKEKLEKGSFMIDNYNNTEKRSRYM